MTTFGYAIVFVFDMDRSVAFYRDTLGLPLKFQSPEWSEFATPSTTLALHKAGPKNAADDRAELHAGTCQLGFSVPSLDAFHAEMTAHGIPCLQPPAIQNFGAKLAKYADPDGLPFSVSEAQAQ